MGDYLAQLLMALGLGQMDIITSTTSLSAGATEELSVTAPDDAYMRIVFKIFSGDTSPGLVQCQTRQAGGVHPHTFTVTADIIRLGVPVWLLVTNSEPLGVILTNLNESMAVSYQMSVLSLVVSTREAYEEVRRVIAHLGGVSLDQVPRR